MPNASRMTGVAVDGKDEAILAALKANSRLSEKKLARATGIPMTTVHNRLKKLEASKVIKGYTALVDYTKLGKPITAFVLVKAGPQADQKKLLSHIANLSGVFEAAMITGEFDMLFKARVANMEELNKLVVQGLRREESISETRTMISYETVEKP